MQELIKERIQYTHHGTIAAGYDSRNTCHEIFTIDMSTKSN